ncbi:Glu-tRNA(Gln) amidotransferase subunit GatE [Candidatus Woesearchaeota archaeon]|nr:Glu-tRNA(Gln) amidotransferase subunit GatE [Candidatus Woesearchaeota archaeon]
METPEHKKLGLKVGLEIHQQLKGSKLFCRCPGDLTDKTDFVVTRFLRPVVGELGAVDVAAQMEMSKKRWFEYTGSRDHVCLVDLDEAPPLSISSDALRAVLQIAKLLNASIVESVQVMRKIVIDGSNTSGFQRTALVAMDGVLETSLGPVRIPTISIEEDSAQKRGEDTDRVLYNLDRLGIPLIEIGTMPDIKTPEHAKEVAETLGMLLRSTGLARRGLGTIRQDVNVSIAGGARVEIKGAQDLRKVPTIVSEEVARQQSLLKLQKECLRRAIEVGPIEEIAEPKHKWESRVLRKALDADGAVFGMCVKGADGLLGFEIQSGRRLGSELASHAKRAAGLRGLFHSDELPNYGITAEDVAGFREELLCSTGDAFILVAASKDRAHRALNAVGARLKQLQKSLPKEVRNALDSGTSEFLRPMPGAARMYPETDIPSIHVTADLLDAISVPEKIDDRAARYEKLGMSKDLALLAAKSDACELVEELVSSHKKLKPSYVAELVLRAQKVVKSEFGVECSPTDKDWHDLLTAVEKGKITKESVMEILSTCKPVHRVLSDFSVLSDKELRKRVQSIVDKHKKLPVKALIGVAMKELRGKAPGKKIVALVREFAD